METISDELFIEKKKEYDKIFPEKNEKETVKDLLFYRDQSRKLLAGICSVNKVCDGNPDRLCMGQKYGKAIGLGGAGQGSCSAAKDRQHGAREQAARAVTVFLKRENGWRKPARRGNNRSSSPYSCITLLRTEA